MAEHFEKVIATDASRDQLAHAAAHPKERQQVDAHYQTIPFPFREITAPSFDLVEERDLFEWCGYL